MKHARVLIPVYFNSPQGGLHLHIRSQCVALLKSDFHPVVLCKPGPFADKLSNIGVEVLTTNFLDLQQSIDTALSAGPFDLIHTHPFKARAVALAVAETTNTPTIATFHRNYLDNLPNWHDAVNVIVAVCPAIRDGLLEQTDIDPTKVLIVPNGVDRSIFTSPKDERRPANRPERKSGKNSRNVHQKIAIVSRLDRDKGFLLEGIQNCWQRCAETRSFTVEWSIAGDGSERKLLEEQAEQLNHAAGKKIVHFLGWMGRPSLSVLYGSADLAIGPGRCAMEAMACGTPTIAVGKNCFLGLIHGERFSAALHTNFADSGDRNYGDSPAQMFDEIDNVIYDADLLQEIGIASEELVTAYLDQRLVDDQLLSLYRSILGSNTVQRIQHKRREKLERIWHFSESHDPIELAYYWSINERRDNLSVEVKERDVLVATCNLAADEKEYLTLGAGGFSAPPKQRDEFALIPNSNYRLNVQVLSISATCACSIWFLEYEDDKRIGHTTVSLRMGINTLWYFTSANARFYRVALRFTGVGVVQLSAPMLYRRVASKPKRKPVRYNIPTRSRMLPSYGRWNGENLVFVVGPPRSGTTWVLNTLKAHPDVIAATVDNLDVRINDDDTGETNVFTDNRPFTDAQIKRKFHNLANQHPGKVVVEKTPVHVLVADRIKEIFPECVLILTNRDGRDIVASLVRVGRDPNAWWQGAPSSVQRACKMWREYATGSIRCRREHFPILFSYEEATANPQTTFYALFVSLGIATQPLSECIERGQDRSAVRLPGYFGSGRPGTWRRFLEPNEIDDFHRIAGEENLRLGYTLD